MFPSPTGRVLNHAALTNLLHGLGIDAVAHGFRSSFRDWAAECTDAPREVCELALAHVNSDRVEAAYRRSDLFDRRGRGVADGRSVASLARRAEPQQSCESALDAFALAVPCGGCGVSSSELARPPGRRAGTLPFARTPASPARTPGPDPAVRGNRAVVPERAPHRREERVAGSGAADGVPEGGVSAVPDHHDGDGAMSTAMTISGSTAATFLTHFFGRRLTDERYVVERFQAMADGDIRRLSGETPAKIGRGARRTVATLKAVREMRPARNEIIVCTGLRSRGGVQYWGWIAMGLGLDRKQKG